MKKALAREWLWFAGCLVIGLFVYGGFVLLLNAEAEPSMRSTYRQLFADALFDRDHLGFHDLGIPVGIVLYVLVGIVRLTIWSVRNART
jgi:hypothetical protein